MIHVYHVFLKRTPHRKTRFFHWTSAWISVACPHYLLIQSQVHPNASPYNIIPIPSLSEKQTHQLLDFYIFIILYIHIYIYIPFKYHFSISHKLKPMLCHDLRKLRRRTAAGPPASQLLADLERLHGLAATHQLGASERPSLSAGPGMDAAGHTTWWRHGNLKLRGKQHVKKGC